MNGRLTLPDWLSVASSAGTREGKDGHVLVVGHAVGGKLRGPRTKAVAGNASSTGLQLPLDCTKQPGSLQCACSRTASACIQCPQGHLLRHSLISNDNLLPTFPITNGIAPHNDQNGGSGQVGNRRPTHRKGGPLLVRGRWGGLWRGLALGATLGGVPGTSEMVKFCLPRGPKGANLTSWGR